MMSKKTRQAEPGVRVAYYDWSRHLPAVTNVAFILALALVIVRATCGEFLREAFDAYPGTDPAAHIGLPDRSLWLDLLCMLPALLVLFRRAVDRTYVLRFGIAHGLILLFAAWACLSTFWSADRFAALVQSFHLLSAATLCWAGSQLVRSWQRLRFVAACFAGLLGILAVQAIYYRTTELPELRKVVNDPQRKQAILTERGWTENGFAWQQFKRKVEYGEMVGFYTSPNTNAAMVVMLALIAGTLAIQRLRDRDEKAWPVILLLLVPLGAYVVFYASTKAAYLTPIIGVALILTGWRMGGRLAERRKLAFAAACGVLILIVVAVVGHGLYHGSLVNDSLTFRLKYWVGSAGVFREHVLPGVGYGNFGYHYLAHRLPEASEEIKDPHNLLVRAFVELGMVGGLLMLGFLVRLAWEATRPVAPAAQPPGTARPGLNAVFFLTGLVLAGAAVFAVDWTVGWDYAVMEMLRRLLYAGVLILLVCAGTIRSSTEPHLDDRPAPLLMVGMLAAMAVFMLHNTIDFAFYESGPMHAFMILSGAILGVRGESLVGRKKYNRLTVALAGIAIVLWFSAMVALVIPVGDAERRAQSADDALRRGEFGKAISGYKAAFELSPVGNADYAYRAARAMTFAQRDPSQRIDPDTVEIWHTHAINANPMDGGYRLARAAYGLSFPADRQNRQQIAADYRRAIDLDPSNIPSRLALAAVLEEFGDRAAAANQLREALRRNDLLDRNEPKRLPADRVDAIKAKLAELGG